MTRYEQGFMNKCAEYGLDVGTSVALMKKIAERDHLAGADAGAGIGMLAAGVPTAALAGHTGFHLAAHGEPSLFRIATTADPHIQASMLHSRNTTAKYVNPLGKLISKLKGEPPEFIASNSRAGKYYRNGSYKLFKGLKLRGKLGVIARALSDAALMAAPAALAGGTVGAVTGGILGKEKKSVKKK